jgi:acetoin utilization deacetylase AcuC-like enzyme
VLVDGADVRDVAADSLRSAIAVVNDDPFLFSATVAENIAYARGGDAADVTREEIELAARRAQADGAERVAILDWDVHHGNGTQAIFDGDETVLFVSLHQWPFYPGSGGPHEQGPTLLNVPLAAGSGDRDYAAAFAASVEPRILAFDPDLLLVSAGFDAHVEDPLADMRVTADGFHELARRSAALAPRVAAVLEGGYNLETLPALVEAALEGFDT